MRLVAPDSALLAAALTGEAELERSLGAPVIPGWAVFPHGLERERRRLAANPAAARWGPRLFLAGDPEALVGWGGFKGPPRDGAVELGYAIAPARQGRGLATTAVRAMLREAFSDPDVRAVLAHTLAGPGPSPRVLEKAGFAYEGAITDAHGRTAWRFRILDGALPA